MRYNKDFQFLAYTLSHFYPNTLESGIIGMECLNLKKSQPKRCFLQPPVSLKLKSFSIHSFYNRRFSQKNHPKLNAENMCLI